LCSKDKKSFNTTTTIIIISKSFRKYVSTIPGNHEVKELQKTAIVGTAHMRMRTTSLDPTRPSTIFYRQLLN
jgi:hypothetical protein